MKLRKRFLLLLIVIALPVLGYSGIVLTNNYLAQRIETELAAYQLPTKTVLVDSLGVAGKLTGNGNGMQYMCAILVESDVWDLTKYAKMCVDAGKHIHMDKPASGTLADYKYVLDTAKAKKLVVQLGYMYRYNPAVLQCFEHIKNGDLGEIYSINAEMSTFHPVEYRKWLQNFGGGIMYILGSHLVDLIVYMMGEPKKVTSFLKHTGLDGIDFEDNNLAVLEYDKALARIFVSSVEVNGFGRRQLVVSGSKGTVNICPLERPITMTYSDTEIADRTYEDRKIIIPFEDNTANGRYDEMMQDFYAYIIGTKQNPFTYEHDYLVQKVLNEIVGGVSFHGKNMD